MLLMKFYILAGGRSKRMGRNKALLRLGRKTLVECVAGAIPENGHAVTLITNAPETYSFLGLRMIPDKIRGIGPLAGIHAGLHDADQSACFFLACDIPLISTEMLLLLLDRYRDQDVVAANTKRGPEPLCAIYSTRCLEVVERQVQSGDYSLQELLKHLDCDYVEAPDDRLLLNVNYPEDYNVLKAKGLHAGD